MKYIYILTLFSSGIFLPIVKAQPSEKFLKLNRIVTLDSTKYVNFNLSANTIFSVNVPSNVYWRIDNLIFNNDPIATGQTGAVSGFLIKINNVFLPQLDEDKIVGVFTGSVNKIFPTTGREFARNTPLWLGPNTLLTAIVTGVGNIKFNLYLVAQEFYLEQ